jgi:hypothetical protein
MFWLFCLKSWVDPIIPQKNPLNSTGFLSKMRTQADSSNSMKFFYLTLALLFASTSLPLAQEPVKEVKQYRNIKPELNYRFKRKDMSFCKVFPHLAFKKKLCNPMPEQLGHIEWCREDVTITDRDNSESYEAVVITYRKVYCNGAWGEKFKRTYRKEATIVTPPLAQNVIK